MKTNDKPNKTPKEEFKNKSNIREVKSFPAIEIKEGEEERED